MFSTIYQNKNIQNPIKIPLFTVNFNIILINPRERNMKTSGTVLSYLVVLRAHFILKYLRTKHIDKEFAMYCKDRQIVNIYIYKYWLRGRVFTNGPGDGGSISGRVIKKWSLIPTRLSLRIIWYVFSKVKQSRERRSALPYTSVL